MGFNFNLFTTTQQHRVFNYRPVYYDPEKEQFREKLRKKAAERELEESAQEPSKDYVPGSIIQGSFRDGAYRTRKTEGGTLVRIFKYLALVAVAGLLYYFAKYFMYLVG